MSESINTSRRKFIIGAGGLIAAGIVATYFYRNSKNELVEIHIDRIADFTDETVFDVCVVGSGPAGAILATQLVKQGYKVLIVESGLIMHQDEYDDRVDQLDRYSYVGNQDYPLAVTRMRALGGTSNMWTGRCSRLHPIDFEKNAYTPEGMDWPVRYPEIQEYYSESEKIFRVRGDKLSEYHAPRKNDLPLHEASDIDGLRELMASADVVIDSSPSSTSPSGSGPTRVATDLIPDYLLNQNAHLITGATVTKLVTDSEGNVSGVNIKNLDNSEVVIKAKQYVVACGAVESSRLLLMSTSESHPNGIGNEFDNVGRYFNEHPNVGFRGKISHNASTLSPSYELARCHQFYDQLKKEGYGSALLVITQSWVFPQDLKDWSFQGILEKAKNMFGRLVSADLQIGATLEMYPHRENRVRLSDNKEDYFGNPAAELHMNLTDKDEATIKRTRDLIHSIYQKLGATDIKELPISWSHHHIGGCCMGNDPKTSVVDANLKVHGMNNLYVAGSGVFVTGGAAHPTLAISALSLRLAGRLNSVLKA